MKARFTYFFCALTHDGEPVIRSANADTIASALAVALAKLYDLRLFTLFEKRRIKGILMT